MKLRKSSGFSSYRRRTRNPRLKRIILRSLTVLAVLVAAVILTALYGNMLRRRAEESRAEQPEVSGTAVPLPTQTEPKEYSVPHVRALPLPLSSLTSVSALAGGITEASASGLQTFSLYLNRKGEAPLWAVSSSLPGTAAGTGELAAGEIFMQLSGSGSGSVVLFECSCFDSGKSVAEREAAAAYDRLLIRELASAGARDILLTGFTATTTDTGGICAFLSSLSDLGSNTILGVSVLPEIEQQAKPELLYSRLLDLCDYLALDLSAELQKDTANTAEASGNTYPALSAAYNGTLARISRYDMRVLLLLPENIGVNSDRLTALEARLDELAVLSYVIVTES